MQSEQTTPPKRIWADPPETFDGMDIWRSEPGGKGVPYILAAPTALASSAEVQALLRDARAQGMEEAANIAVRHDLSIMSISSADMRARQIAQAIRTAAAALRAGGLGMTQRPFPDEWSCTAWEDCQHDGICHDPKGCGAIGPNHGCFYGMTDEEVDAAWNRRTPEPGKDGNNG